MGTRVAINGFARPGRMIPRALVERGLLGERVQVVAIADGASPGRGHWIGGRAAAVDVIPSHGGSARSIGILMPELSGKLRGMAFLVPGSRGSVVDLLGYILDREV